MSQESRIIKDFKTLVKQTFQDSICPRCEQNIFGRRYQVDEFGNIYKDQKPLVAPITKQVENILSDDCDMTNNSGYCSKCEDILTNKEQNLNA